MLKYKLHHYFLAVLSLLFFEYSYGQKYFKANATAAVVGTQLDGDGYGGYKKLGIYASVGVFRNFSRLFSWHAEIMFIQKGSQKLADPIKNDFSYYKLNVNYIGVPLYLRFRQEKYFVDLGAEISTTVLRKKEEAINFNTSQKLDDVFPFNRVAYDYLWGFGYYLNKKWEVGLRASYSIVPARTSFDRSIQRVFATDFYSRIVGFGQYHNTIRLFATYNFIKSE
jgi:Outer membrane protein beta-barrel domain